MWPWACCWRVWDGKGLGSIGVRALRRPAPIRKGVDRFALAQVFVLSLYTLQSSPVANIDSSSLLHFCTQSPFQRFPYYHSKQHLITSMPMAQSCAQPDSQPYILIPGSNFHQNSGAAVASFDPGSQERLPGLRTLESLREGEESRRIEVVRGVQIF
jgi:hypothetical protein